MTSRTATTDSGIRSAFHAKRLRYLKAQPGTLVIDELGLAHAKCRIDVAVINGCIHGYEIKSARDTLKRLESQIDIYSQTLQKLTIVAAPKHITNILTSAPEWCGIIEVEQGPRGGIYFSTLRSARKNPNIDPVMMAHLLWRNEALELLAQLGYRPKELRRPRKELYEILSETINVREMTNYIISFMVRRRAWRDHRLHE